LLYYAGRAELCREHWVPMHPKKKLKQLNFYHLSTLQIRSDTFLSKLREQYSAKHSANGAPLVFALAAAISNTVSSMTS
jgi:hypothetical protein